METGKTVFLETVQIFFHPDVQKEIFFDGADVTSVAVGATVTVAVAMADTKAVCLKVLFFLMEQFADGKLCKRNKQSPSHHAVTRVA